MKHLSTALFGLILLTACGRAPTPSQSIIQTAIAQTQQALPTSTQVPTVVPIATTIPPSATIMATDTIVPTGTSAPTNTPLPTDTPIPPSTATTIPTPAVTPTPLPSETPVATATHFPTNTPAAIATTVPTLATTQTSAPTAVPAVASTPSQQAQTQAHVFGNGTFVVGSDIAPGIYRSTQGVNCYWARLSGFGGTLGEILGNDNATGPTVVTILPTDKGFESDRCGQWTSNLSPITANTSAPFVDGTYIVGVDISAGQWKSSSQSGCYWARLGGFSGTLRDIIANNNVDGPTVVQIGAGDRGFSSVRCGTWTVVQGTTTSSPQTTLSSGSACPSANVCITTPVSGLTAYSGDVVVFTGSATGNGFARYQFLAGNGSAWGHIADFNTPVVNGKLMDFHTETIPPGTYIILLQVIDNTGNVKPEKAQIVLTIQ